MVHQVLFGSDNRPLRLAQTDIACFILDNQHKVCSLTGLQKALGYDGKSENWLKDLLTHVHRFIPADEHLNGLENAPVFENDSAQKNIGVSAPLFVGICEKLVLAKNEGFLSVSQLKYAKSAEALLKNLTVERLESMIEDASGFLFFKENAVERFSRVLSTELNDAAFEWTRTFPDDFYQKVFELHHYDWADLQNNPKSVGRIFYDVVFSRISNDLLEELREKKPKRNYRRKNYMPQDNQHPRLKEYISTLLSLLNVAIDNWNIFLQLLNRSYPKNDRFTTKFPVAMSAAPKPEPLSGFNQILKGMS